MPPESKTDTESITRHAIALCAYKGYLNVDDLTIDVEEIHKPTGDTPCQTN